jgi:hypothetical protein
MSISVAASSARSFEVAGAPLINARERPSRLMIRRSRQRFGASGIVETARGQEIRGAAIAGNVEFGGNVAALGGRSHRRRGMRDRPVRG